MRIVAIAFVLLASHVAVAKASKAKAAPAAPTAEAVADAPLPAAHAPKLRVIALDPKRPKAVYKVSAAPGLATIIQLPEPWAVMPRCGDCVFGDDAPQGQLYRLDVSPETRTLSIKPTRLPSPELPAAAFITNIDVSLQGGISVTLFVEMTMPENADARVELTLPADATSAAKMTLKERELEETFAARVDVAATKKLAQALMAGTVCRDFFGRPNRNDGLVVRMKQLCKNGAMVYVTFEVENRKRADVAIESATLLSADGAASSGSEVEREVLRFNQTSLGFASIAMNGLAARPTTYTLTVTEDGGAGRQVVIDGIEF